MAMPAFRPTPIVFGGSRAQPQPKAQPQGATLVKQVSGPIERAALSPSIKPFEQMWSAQPNDAWYDPARNPNSATRVEIGSYRVPEGTGILLLDFDFQAWQPSGAGAYESEPVPFGRLSGCIGFYIDINNNTPGIINYELEPTPANYQQRKFRPLPGKQIPIAERVNADYLRTQATTYASSSFGTGLLPVRPGRNGAPDSQWSFYCEEKQNISLSMLVYRPIPYPLNMVRGTISGYLSTKQVMSDLVAGLAVTAR